MPTTQAAIFPAGAYSRSERINLKRLLACVAARLLLGTPLARRRALEGGELPYRVAPPLCLRPRASHASYAGVHSRAGIWAKCRHCGMEGSDGRGGTRKRRTGKAPAATAAPRRSSRRGSLPSTIGRSRSVAQAFQLYAGVGGVGCVREVQLLALLHCSLLSLVTMRAASGMPLGLSMLAKLGSPFRAAGLPLDSRHHHWPTRVPCFRTCLARSRDRPKH